MNYTDQEARKAGVYESDDSHIAASKVINHRINEFATFLDDLSASQQTDAQGASSPSGNTSFSSGSYGPPLTEEQLRIRYAKRAETRYRNELKDYRMLVQRRRSFLYRLVVLPNRAVGSTLTLLLAAIPMMAAAYGTFIATMAGLPAWRIGNWKSSFVVHQANQQYLNIPYIYVTPILFALTLILGFIAFRRNASISHAGQLAATRLSVFVLTMIPFAAPVFYLKWKLHLSANDDQLRLVSLGCAAVALVIAGLYSSSIKVADMDRKVISDEPRRPATSTPDIIDLVDKRK